MRQLTDVTLQAFIYSKDMTRGSVYTIDNHCPNCDRPAHLVSAINNLTTQQCPDLDLEKSLTQHHINDLASRCHLGDTFPVPTKLITHAS